jgi:hypothetical protein
MLHNLEVANQQATNVGLVGNFYPYGKEGVKLLVLLEMGNMSKMDKPPCDFCTNTIMGLNLVRTTTP